MGKYSKYVNSENLRRERAAKRISVEEMAARMSNRKKSTYWNIENGIVEPRITMMIKVSAILDKPVEYFFNYKVQDACIMDAG